DNCASVLTLQPYSCSFSSRIHQHLHSFPTRRSSDLRWPGCCCPPRTCCSWTNRPTTSTTPRPPTCSRSWPTGPARCCWPGPAARSEEHTSELQSRFEIVCRHLLEKKKKICKDTNTKH